MMYIQRKYEWVDKTDIKINIYKFEKVKIIANIAVKNVTIFILIIQLNCYYNPHFKLLCSSGVKLGTNFLRMV